MTETQDRTPDFTPPAVATVPDVYECDDGCGYSGLYEEFDEDGRCNECSASAEDRAREARREAWYDLD